MNHVPAFILAQLIGAAVAALAASALFAEGKRSKMVIAPGE